MKRQEELIVSLLIVFLDYKAFRAAPVNNSVFVQCVRRQMVLYFPECLPVFHFQPQEYYKESHIAHPTCFTCLSF